jgi:pyruvate-formate lyase-activating enzyme
MSAGEVMADILTYRAFIARGGVTLSGGEPLLQPAFTCAVLDGCREQRLHCALDTSVCRAAGARRPGDRPRGSGVAGHQGAGG